MKQIILNHNWQLLCLIKFSSDYCSVTHVFNNITSVHIFADEFSAVLIWGALRRAGSGAGGTNTARTERRRIQLALFKSLLVDWKHG